MSTDPEPVGDLTVARVKDTVKIHLEYDDDEAEFYLPPELAARAGMWLNQAAADAKRWRQREEGSRQ